MGNAITVLRFKPSRLSKVRSHSQLSSSHRHSRFGSENLALEQFAQQETWRAGRRQLLSIPYFLPVDPIEVKRGDMLHAVLVELLNGELYIPFAMTKGNTAFRNILDVGTGSARWVKEMALKYPKARVTGIDVSRDVFYTFGLPNNAILEEGNILEGLRYPSSSFDFLHHRLLYAAIPFSAWAMVLSEYYRVLQSPGFLQIVEPKFFFNTAGPTELVNCNRTLIHLISMAAASGIDLGFIDNLPSFLHGIGFTDVHMHTRHIILGKTHGGSIGEHLLNSLVAMLQGAFALAHPMALSCSKEDFERCLKGMHNECETSKVWMELCFLVARKP